jgi:hypothetical protein
MATASLKILCCEVFYREVCGLVAESPLRCDVEFLPKGLHDLGSERMVARLQERVDACDDGPWTGVALVYGLCNNGTVGLRARKHRLVIPRAHDCIALFLGDRHRYRRLFDAHPGTYYRTTGWIERADAAGAGEETVPQKLGLFMRYEELVEKYGEDNARYIMDTMGDATANYDRLAFIRMGLACEDRFRAMAEEEARRKGWAFEEIPGSMALLRKLTRGEWDDDFLLVEPGHTLRASHDDGVMKVEPAVAGGPTLPNASVISCVTENSGEGKLPDS